MRNFKVYSSYDESPFSVTQEQCNRINIGLKTKLGVNYRFLLPKIEAISDSEIYRLDYLNTALELIQKYPGFDKHVDEYRNNPFSTYFVTVVADLLVSHGLRIVLEPENIGINKKADILAYQKDDGLKIFFECKQPNDDTGQYIKEQRKIFEGIKDVISNQYSLAMFYKKELTSGQIIQLREQIINNLLIDSKIYENRILATNEEQGFELIVSGISNQIYNNSKIEVTGIPNFSDLRKYSRANGINHFGKNLVFYREGSMNTIDSLLKNSKNKVIIGEPFVVCLDLSGSKFNWDDIERYIIKHFERADYKQVSGVIFIQHGLLDDGNYGITSKYIHNLNSRYPIEFLSNFFFSPIKVNIESRYL